MRAKPDQHAVHSAAAAAVFRVRAGCGRGVRSDDDRALRDDDAADCHRAAGRHPSFAGCTAVGERRSCPIHLPGRTQAKRKEEPNSIRSLAPLKTQAECLVLGREMEVQVRSYYRAHRESVPRQVLVLKGPLAPDTDRHHRRIRERVVDCRTDGCAGRDEKDVGVRSCSCGVAEKKSAARTAHGDRGHNSREIRNLILFEMARYKSCARARMVLSTAGIVQQQFEWYGAARVLSSALHRVLYAHD